MAVVWRKVWGEILRAASEGHRCDAVLSATRKRCSTPERDMRLPERLGKTEALWTPVNVREPGAEHGCRAFPEGHHALLASLAVQMQRGRAIEQDVCDL
jgi:hypothetical protein